MGSGDLKLMAGVGAIAGPRDAVGMFLAAALIGGVLGLSLWIAQGRARAGLERLYQGFVLSFVTRERRVMLGTAASGDEDDRLPYALPIALGSLLVLAARLSSLHLPNPL
jgi:prepilin peptidase CpaA